MLILIGHLELLRNPGKYDGRQIIVRFKEEHNMNPGSLQTFCQIGIVVFSILVLICTFGSFHYGKKADEIKVNDNKKHVDQLIVGQDEIIKLLKKTEEPIYDRLKREYSLGYALHYLDGTRIIYDKTQTLFNINWSETKVLEFSDTKIVLRLPDWIDANHNRFQGNIVGLSRKPGSKMTPVVFGKVKTTVECISTDSKSAIVVIGFSEIT